MERAIIGREIVYVTPFGLYNNMYARKVNKQVTADNLFKDTETFATFLKLTKLR